MSLAHTKVTLDIYEQDGLRELFNMGIGRAAFALSRMTKNEVVLSVPHLSILDPEQFLAIIRERGIDMVAAICQNFTGSLSGTAFLIYPEAQSLELVRSLLGDDMPLESLTELEQESLLEVGNIILNACLGTFANMMHQEIKFELPDYMKGNCDNLLRFYQSTKRSQLMETQVVFLIVDFISNGSSLDRHAIKGFVILLLETDALTNLKVALAQLMGR